MNGKMDIDHVIEWIDSTEGNQGKELAYLLKKYYKNSKDRFISTETIKGIFKEFLPYGIDSFRCMECDVVTHLY